MCKITLPVAAVQTGGNLRDWFLDLISVNNEVNRIRDNGNVVINDNNASQEQKIILNQQNILDILTEGGEVEEYLAGIRVPNPTANASVPSGLPYRVNALGQVKDFRDWFLPGAELWMEDSGDEFIFYTNPAAGLASPADYLKGSQMEIIRQLDTVNNTILTVDEVATVVSSGWTKVVWS